MSSVYVSLIRYTMAWCRWWNTIIAFSFGNYSNNISPISRSMRSIRLRIQWISFGLVTVKESSASSSYIFVDRRPFEIDSFHWEIYKCVERSVVTRKLKNIPTVDAFALCFFILFQYFIITLEGRRMSWRIEKLWVYKKHWILMTPKHPGHYRQD